MALRDGQTDLLPPQAPLETLPFLAKWWGRSRPFAWTISLALLLGLAAIPRLWLAWWDQGIFWPDEIYQSLEQAHRLVFGYGIVPWEFEQGARSWLFPALFAAVFKPLAWIGADSGPVLVITAKLLMAVLSIATVYGAMRLARQLGGDAAGVLTGFLAAVYPAALLLGSRALSEVASATFLVFSASLVVRNRNKGALTAGVLAGLATFVRYQAGIVALGLLALLLFGKRGRHAARFAVGGGVVALLGGALDWATWDAPFHSAWTYLSYNIIDGQSADYGVEPWWYYASVAWTATGPALGAVILGLLWGARRAPGLLLICAAFIFVHSAIGHKEFRFLMPILPMVLAVAGAGLAELLSHLPNARRAIPLVGVLLAAAMGQKAVTLRFEDIGQYSGQPAGSRSAWREGDDLNRLLWDAGQREDLCGLWLANIRALWAGGYTYLHRDVPIFPGPYLENRWGANYLLLPLREIPLPISSGDVLKGVPAGYAMVGARRNWALFRREGYCMTPGTENDGLVQ